MIFAMGLVLLFISILAIIDPVGTKLADDNDPFGDTGRVLFPIIYVVIAIVMLLGSFTFRRKVTRD